MYDSLLSDLLLGCAIAFRLDSLLAIFVGMVAGIVIGAVPGIGATVGVALLLPFTFSMDPAAGLMMLVALYIGAEYGGSVSAILISTPGTAAAAATILDGYPLTQKGQPGKALGISLLSGTVASVLGTIGLVLLAIPLVSVALSFGPYEYFALAVFGLSIIAGLTGRNILAGFVSALLGLLVGMVGLDPITGVARFTFGRHELHEGFGLLPPMLGLFAISVVLEMAETGDRRQTTEKVKPGALPTWKEIRETFPSMVRGAVQGFIIGVIPGAGATIASFIAYNTEKRLSKHPEKFGTGVLEGLAAAEAANNSVVPGSLVTLLTLGIPGSATAAIMVGALVMHNIDPGPQLFRDERDVVYGLFVGMMLANFLMQAMGLLGMQWWVRVIDAPPSILGPAVMALAIIGTYSFRNSMFDVWVMLFFGVVGYLMHKYHFSLVAMVLALVLERLVELSLRQGLIVFDGSLTPLLTRPIPLSLIIVSIVMMVYMSVQDRRAAKRFGQSGEGL